MARRSDSSDDLEDMEAELMQSDSDNYDKKI